MDSYYLLLCLLMLPLVLLLKSKLKSHSLNQNCRLPPGPWTLPIIGSIHHLIGRGLPPRALDSLSRQYGGLMFLQLGELPAVVVSSREAAREILKTHDLKFSNRHVNPAMKFVTYDGKDIVAAPYGKYWREVRKMSVLELFSTKRVRSFRSVREEETKNLIEQISLVSATGQFFNLSAMLLSLVNDAALQALMGSKAKQQNLLLTETQKVAVVIAHLSIGNMFPSSRLASLFSSAVHRAKQFRINIDRLFDDIIKEHRNKEGAGGAEDLLSILIRIHDEDSDNKNFSMENVKAIIIDIIAGGTETSATLIDWAMAELLKNPGIMKKAQSEIRQQLQGREKLTESDLVDLDSIHLIVKETMRMHPPTPLLLPRECRETCNIQGYDIPEGTTVIVNAWSLGNNPNYWKDAEEFKPERFAEVDTDARLQADGADFRYIPFGAGRRKCPGDLFGLAIVELALANLLYHFDWELPHGMNPTEIDMTEILSASSRRKSPLLLRALPYRC